MILSDGSVDGPESTGRFEGDISMGGSVAMDATVGAAIEGTTKNTTMRGNVKKRIQGEARMEAN